MWLNTPAHVWSASVHLLLATSRQDSPPRPRPCAACGAYTHRPRGRACRLGWWIDGSLMALARSRLSMELLHRMFSSQGVLKQPQDDTKKTVESSSLRPLCPSFIVFAHFKGRAPRAQGGARARDGARGGLPATCLLQKWPAARRGGAQAAGGAGPPELAAGPKAGRPAPETGPNAATAARAGAPRGH